MCYLTCFLFKETYSKHTGITKSNTSENHVKNEIIVCSLHEKCFL